MDVRRAIARYRASGQKITPQRLAVMQALAGDRSHPAAAAVVERVRARLPFVSPATVYRVLEELSDMGEIVPLDLGSGAMRFDTNVADHSHLVCEVCGTVEDVEWRLAADALPPHLRRGFSLAGARVVFRGRCPACAGRASPSTGPGPGGAPAPDRAGGS